MAGQFNNARENFARSDEDVEETIHLQDMATPGNADFLPTIARPVVSQPQAYTDFMLDATSRGVMSGITDAHLGDARLQRTLRQNIDHLQSTVHTQFASLKKGSLNYKELSAGLINEGEAIQASNNFSFMKYSYLRFSDVHGNTVSQRSAGICLLTNKRLLFLSSELAAATSLSQWGDPKQLPGGYSVQSSWSDTTYYLPIPLRCLRSVEMLGETGVRGQVTVHGIGPCCLGLCELCAFFCCPDSKMLKQWRPQPISQSQVQDMKVTLGVLMPPWERKMFVCIQVDPKVSLPVSRDFVALLQKNSPGLN